MAGLVPKQLFLLVLALAFGLILADHLTSPSLMRPVAPGQLGNACAPCGAPCPE